MKFKNTALILGYNKGANMNKLMNTKQLAEYLGVSISAIMQYRAKGTGPRYVKLGQLVRYTKADVDEWLETIKVG